jgi:hypothetical protein
MGIDAKVPLEQEGSMELGTLMSGDVHIYGSSIIVNKYKYCNNNLREEGAITLLILSE